MQYLDSALLAGRQATTPEYFANNIACQKALAHFDQQQYSRADSLIQCLRQQNYRHLNEGRNRTYIKMAVSCCAFYASFTIGVEREENEPVSAPQQKSAAFRRCFLVYVRGESTGPQTTPPSEADAGIPPPLPL